MQTTMTLLEKAIAIAPIPTWTRRLHLSRDALSNAKSKGHLTPIIAGGLAAELEEDIAKWTTIAAIEGAPSSPAKTALLKRMQTTHTW
jgi:hypothetical protein